MLEIGNFPDRPKPFYREGVNRLPKYDVQVPLVGEDGNAFAIIARVSRAIRQVAGEAEATAYREEAMSGDYDNLLRVSMEWVDAT